MLELEHAGEKFWFQKIEKRIRTTQNKGPNQQLHSPM